MTGPLNDIEQRLADTLGDVATQTKAEPGGLERLRADLTDRAQPEPRSRAGHRWRLGAVAAVLALVAGVGLWAVGVADRPNQATRADATSPDMLGVADLVPATGPLYLLPPEGTDLSGGVHFSDEPSVDVGSGIVVGRLTDTGFHDVALITHLASGPTFGQDEGAPVEIAGRELRQPSYGDGSGGMWTAAEELADGTWIEYTTASGANPLTQSVAATTISNGKLEWAGEQSDLQELGRIADLQSPGTTWVSTFLAEQSTSPGFSIQTSIYDPDLGLAFAGLYGPAEQTTVDGRPAFLIRPDLQSDVPTTALTWTTASGHVVLLLGQMSEEELRELAAGLRSVDRPTWETQLSPHDANHGD